MGAPRRPPLSEPANVQLWRPTAMPRSARSAALLVMHRRPSSRKRVSAVQRLRLYWIALATSFCAESLRRCSRSQVSTAPPSGRATPAAEHEQMAIVRIALQRLLYQQRQAVEALAH